MLQVLLLIFYGGIVFFTALTFLAACFRLRLYWKYERKKQTKRPSDPAK